MSSHTIKNTTNPVVDPEAPIFDHAAEQANGIMQRSLESIRDASQQVQDSALRASHTTIKFIKEEPVKSILIAAATGAALMALVGLMSRSRQRS